jgi:hypothetical protein
VHACTFVIAKQVKLSSKNLEGFDESGDRATVSELHDDAEVLA